MPGNIRGCITLGIFAVVGQIKFIIFQLKMFELESFIRSFHVYYVSWTPRDREVLHCARKSLIEKIPML